MNEAFANSQLDFASQGDLPQIVGRASGLKTRQLAAGGSHAPMYLAVPVKSELRSVKDLKGRKVSIFRGTNNHLAAVKVLTANGLSERDLQGINMDEASTNAALATGNIDARVRQISALLLLEQQGLVKIIYTTKGDNPAFERQGTLIADDGFVTKYPDITQKIVTALVKAAHWSSQEDNREAFFEISARSGRPVAAYRAGLRGPGAQVPKFAPDRRFPDRTVSHRRPRRPGSMASSAATSGVDGWFDPQFVQAAVKQLGLEPFWPRYDVAGKPQDKA